MLAIQFFNWGAAFMGLPEKVFPFTAKWNVQNKSFSTSATQLFSASRICWTREEGTLSTHKWQLSTEQRKQICYIYLLHKQQTARMKARSTKTTDTMMIAVKIVPESDKMTKMTCIPGIPEKKIIFQQNEPEWPVAIFLANAKLCLVVTKDCCSGTWIYLDLSGLDSWNKTKCPFADGSRLIWTNQAKFLQIKQILN